MTTPALLSEHGKHDWCHLCGNRTSGLCDVWYADNAEHDNRPLTEYVRICGKCAEAVAKTANNAATRAAKNDGYDSRSIEDQEFETLA